MPIEYRLSPDSPLLRDGLFDRITPSLDSELELELLLSVVQIQPVTTPQDDESHPQMQIDEYLALLSFPGVVWFVSMQLLIQPRQAAVAILLGMPGEMEKCLNP